MLSILLSTISYYLNNELSLQNKSLLSEIEKSSLIISLPNLDNIL